MATVSVAVGQWAKEAMADPLWDAWAVLQPAHQWPEETDRADFLELFAGKANISAAFARKQKGVLEPRDLLYDHDLRCGRVQEEVIEDIWEHRPRMIWLAPPCPA